MAIGALHPPYGPEGPGASMQSSRFAQGGLRDAQPATQRALREPRFQQTREFEMEMSPDKYMYFTQPG